MILSRLFLWFLIYSFGGWLFETVHGVIVTGKWENRGFLYGPLVPIYGVGAVAITVLNGLLISHGLNLRAWQIFLISFVGSIFLEYGTSWILEKRFHAVWWDYSNMPFNVHGRICLPASTLFGIAGVLVIKFSAPFLERITTYIPMILVEGIALLMMALISMDTTLTVSALTGFEKMIAEAESDLNHYMENRVEFLHEKTSGVAQKVLEERDLIFTEHMERVAEQLDRYKVGAIGRIRGFRVDPKKYTEHTIALKHKAFEIMSKKFPRW